MAEVKYTDQTLVVPADVCEILERENLLYTGCDDFGLTIEVENGKLKITDMMEYVVKGYKSLEPKEAWILVRQWWNEIKETQKYQIAINTKETEIEKLRNEVALIEKKQKKIKWRLF